ncbi:unnamed protein product [Cladocopium goreaui]|uniref:Uncharacterized protein n=1 Tax=Cladocopium goreaui TaxID=2562237 RepID=A0A9P1BFZ5_9DINO|nr:unnamed protein product [Cladocopium goreaui]
MAELADDEASNGVLQKIATYFDSVIEEQNFGRWVNSFERPLLNKVLESLVMSPATSESKPTLSVIPNTSLKEFWLPLSSFDVSARSKTGYYPQNVQLAAHVREFLKDGYRVGAEAVEVKFHVSDGSRRILESSVGISDGFAKVLLMCGITLICHQLELTPEQLALPGVKKVLDSFRMQHVTSQKQAPSPIDLLGAMQQAVNIERRRTRGGASTALRDVLAKCVGDYNRMVTKKSHRVDTNTKNLCLNMLRTNEKIQNLVHGHYDLYPHTVSALPIDVLQQDWWVPGSTSRADSPRYQGKNLFKEILTITMDSCELWMTRATEDFKRRVGPDASTKAKKNAQLGEEDQLLLHDCVCLWLWLLPKLENEFPKPVVDKHYQLFLRGSLDSDLSGVMRAAQPFEWERIPFVLEVKGECVDDFITQAQDRTRNAQSKSLQAAWLVWREMLQADQITFESEKISMHVCMIWGLQNKFANLQAMHNKAWDLVSSYMDQNLKAFAGRAIEAESTLLPQVTGWIHDTLNDLPEIRSVDDHCIVVWSNLTTVGVMPAAKLDFFLTAISNILASHKRNALAILIHPNRASDTGKSGEKKEKMEKEEDDDFVLKGEKEEDAEDGDSDGLSEENEKDNPEESDIRDIKHKLEKALSAKSRNLWVKNLTWAFDKATVYGKRDACIHGLAIVHRDKANLFRNAAAWKHALVRDCVMLPRSQMYKPEAQANTPHLGRAFTDAQELRQVAGGTDFIRRTLSSFWPETVSTCILIDLHTYDCFPALAALEESSENRRVLCANILLDRSPESTVQRISNAIYNSCRAGDLKLVGFPNFDPVISALQTMKPEDSGKEYEVTIKKHDRLVVLQSFAAKWMDTEFKDQTITELENHNQRYNPGGEYWHETERAPSDEESSRPHKRIKLDDSELGKEADVVNLTKPYSFSINNIAEMVCGQDGVPLYLVSRGKNQFLTHRELFSFGSGDWRMSQDAEELMQDSNGRWFSFCIDHQTVMILEKKGLPSHLGNLPCVDSPTYLSAIIRELEDAGEVKLAVTHHVLSSDKVSQEKPLVFLMDPPKDPKEDREEGGKPKRKKQKKEKGAGTMTNKNFGSVVDIAKLKKANRLLIGWRIRLDCNNSSGLKTIVPIRPVACVTGVLDLGETVIKIY